MVDLEQDFCFPCFTCQTKFYSLRELRKHPCEMLHGNPMNILVQTTTKNKKHDNHVFLKQQTEIFIKLQTDKNVTEESNFKESISPYSVLPKKKSARIDDLPCPEIIVKEESNDIDYNSPSKVLSKQKTDPIDCLPCTHQDCSKVFATPKLLYSHRWRVHGIQRMFSCDICPYSSKEKKNVSRHKNIQHSDLKVVTCTECGESFKCKTSLEYHMKKKYGEYNEQCKSCDYKAITEAQIKNHIMRVHTQLFKVQCTECGKGFTGECYLKYHMTVHTGEKKFKCTFCESRFRNKITLKKHENIHLDVKPYACHICPKQFRGDNNLEVHVKRHLNQKDHVCHTCKRGFIEPAGLRNHSCQPSI